MADFKKSIMPILKREGMDRITDDPNDRGGLTKYGISQRSYPKEDIRGLTLERALFLYKRDYWDKIGGDLISSQKIASILCDSAVNEGVVPAIKRAERILGIVITGKTSAVLTAKINDIV